MKLTEPPLPWGDKKVLSVGGLTSIGFDEDSDHLLVVSHQGRSVIDCLSGEKMSRDREEYFEDGIKLEADGIGILKGKRVRISGLYGGGLPNSTNDRWSLELVTLQWPVKSLFLIEPGSWLYGPIQGKESVFYKIHEWDSIRACGFSPTGRSLVIASSSDVTIYNKC